MTQQSSVPSPITMAGDLNLVSPDELFEHRQDMIGLIIRPAYELFDNRESGLPTLTRAFESRWGTLHLTTKSIRRSTSVFCQGRLVWGTEGTLLATIFSIHDCDLLTLDLVGVHSIDARGLGVLAAVAKWAMRESVELVISNPSQCVHEQIRLVNLDRAIRVVCDGSDDVRIPRR